MSTTYIPFPTYHATITLPSDGEFANVQSVNIPSRALADNDALLKQWSFDLFNNGGDVAPTGIFVFGGSAGYQFIPSVTFGHDVSAPAGTVTAGKLETTTAGGESGNANIAGGLLVAGQIACDNVVTKTGVINRVVAGSIETSTDVGSGDATIAGDAAVAGSVSCSGLSVDGTVSCVGLSVSGLASFGNAVSFTSAGRVVPRIKSFFVAANITSVGPLNADIVIVNPAADIDLVLQDCPTDAVIEVSNTSGANLLTVKDPLGNLIIGLKNISGQDKWARIVKEGVNWTPIVTVQHP